MISLQAILRALFNRGAKLKGDNEAHQQAEVLSDIPLPAPREESTVFQWLSGIEKLQALMVIQVQRIEKEVQSYERQSACLKTMTVLEKQLGQLKEHWLNYKYRCEQFRVQPECFEKNEFKKVAHLSLVIFDLILKLIDLFEKTSIEKVKMNAFQSLIKDLTKKNEDLAQLMISLNRFAYRQEALMQIAELERSLLCSIIKNELMVVTDPNENHISNVNIDVKSEQADWIFKLNRINESEHVALMQSLYEVHYMLSNCYVITRRSVVNVTLEKMNKSLDGLAGCFFQNKIDKNRVLVHLLSIYHCIESLRFCANRDSRSARNLSERSKDAKKLFLHACKQNSIACDFLGKLVNPIKSYKIKR